MTAAKKYLSFFRIRFVNGLQYRAAALAGMATQFAWGFLLILMFSAFYRADPSAFPMEFPQLSSYIWMQQAFLALFATWFHDAEIFGLITGGNIAYELARPVDLYLLWFTRSASTRIAKAVLRCVPVLAVAALLPEPFRLGPPASLAHAALFLLTMLTGFLTVVAYSMLIYISTFYTLDSLGVRIVTMSLADFLSGALVPLPFLPDGLRRVLELTPFAAMQNLPLRVYGGSLSGGELTRGVLLGIFWSMALIVLGKWWMSRALRRVVAQGG